MIVVADENMPLLDETFGRHARIERCSGRAIQRAGLETAEALLVRSVTRVDKRLLNGTAVRFVGSATIGRDHLDTRWMEASGINWCHAPGCNVRAAAEYSVAMILLAFRRLGRPLAGATAGIIGRGNVGRRVLDLLQRFGVNCIACDPPLADEGVRGLVSLNDALQRELVCLHVPLTRAGPYPTHHLLNETALRHMRNGAVLLNAGRGDVVDGCALARELRQGRLVACLDVWPDEPAIDPALLAACTVATPHVAGYSVQGKARGTLAVYRAFCAHFGLQPVVDTLPAQESPSCDVSDAGDPVATAIIRATGVERDDQRLRSAIGVDAIDTGPIFDSLRRRYPDREEFRYWNILCKAADEAALNAVGFTTRGA
jgi:erythronate-4-phosphate dehydrogenase